MTVENLDVIIGSLDKLPVAAMLTELSTRKFVAVNDRAASLFGSTEKELVGSDVIPRIRLEEREAATRAYSAMADGVIDGYQVKRSIVTPEGTDVPVRFWGRRIEGGDKLYGLWILLPGSEPNAAGEVLLASSDVVLAITDHDWQIEYMSADADLLGVHGSELRGFPLLGLIHPSAAAAFLAAATQVATGNAGITIRTRFRVGKDGWADRYCLMLRMCDHQPPRLGVVISGAPAFESAEHQIDHHVRSFELEARATDTMGALAALRHLPEGSELSARQTEIVSKLVAGQSVSEIAKSMFLSPSTIRNHLAAIYRKFGVHSQAELLAALLRDVARHDL